MTQVVNPYTTIGLGDRRLRPICERPICEQKAKYSRASRSVFRPRCGFHLLPQGLPQKPSAQGDGNLTGGPCHKIIYSAGCLRSSAAEATNKPL
jgi:hypothetical protein